MDKPARLVPVNPASAKSQPRKPSPLRGRTRGGRSSYAAVRAELDNALGRDEVFREASAGMHPHRVARAINTFTPGVDWRGCTLAHMREAIRRGEHGLDRISGAEIRAALDRVRK